MVSSKLALTDRGWLRASPKDRLYVYKRISYRHPTCSIVFIPNTRRARRIAKRV